MKHAALSTAESRLAYARSRTSNGRFLFGRDVDQRGAYPRRLRDLLSEHIQDLGGETNTSLAERSILRRIATISVELELLERKFVIANGASAQDLQLYLSASNTLRRLLEAVGLPRRAKDVTPPTWEEIAQESEARHAAEAAELALITNQDGFPETGKPSDDIVRSSNNVDEVAE
jgi:hypothetical protein